jgi:hypothetical protein
LTSWYAFDCCGIHGHRSFVHIRRKLEFLVVIPKEHDNNMVSTNLEGSNGITMMYRGWFWEVIEDWSTWVTCGSKEY